MKFEDEKLLPDVLVALCVALSNVKCNRSSGIKAISDHVNVDCYGTGLCDMIMLSNRLRNLLISIL